MFGPFTADPSLLYSSESIRLRNPGRRCSYSFGESHHQAGDPKPWLCVNRDAFSRLFATRQTPGGQIHVLGTRPKKITRVLTVINNSEGF